VTKLFWWWLAKFCLLLNHLPNQINHSLYRRKNLPLLGLFLGTLILIIGNAKLLFASICGIGMMFIVYNWNDLNWQKYCLQYIKILQGSQKQFTIAVSSGGVIAVTTYMIAVIWTDAENRWLAAGTILQGLISITTLGLLGWQVFHQQLSENKPEFEQYLIDLSDTSPLKRLMAVRYFSNLIKNNGLNSTQETQLEEYFLLMLKIESEPIIRKVLQENILLRTPNQLLTKINLAEKNKPLQIPIKAGLISEKFYNK
jgi:hypothetical protein